MVGVVRALKANAGRSLRGPADCAGAQGARLLHVGMPQLGVWVGAIASGLMMMLTTAVVITPLATAVPEVVLACVVIGAGSWAGVIGWWDCRHLRMPNFLMVPIVVPVALCSGLLAVIGWGWGPLCGAVLWAGMYVGVAWTMRQRAKALIVSRRGRGRRDKEIGGADIKLAVVTGALSGTVGVGTSLLAMLLAQVFSLCLCLIWRTPRVAHGPMMFIAVGCACAASKAALVLWG